MQTTPIGVGSPADQLNQVAILLRLCPDTAAVERRFADIMRRLERVRRRVDRVARQGGSTPGVFGPLRWLDSVLRDHLALDSAEGEPLRADLRGLVAKIRTLA
jgi:hypothetical protein